MTAGLLGALERFLLPNACVVCDRATGETDALLCGPCGSRFRRLPHGCTRCQQPAPPVGPCRFCRDWPDALVAVRSAVWLTDEARTVVHHLKYGGLRPLSAVMGASCARVRQRPAGGVLVPVPLAPRRERDRGFNQAAVLARALARHWRLPVADLLVRTRETASQTRLAPEARLENVTDAFAVSGRTVARRPTGATVILVDDVLTTGATIVACASALADAGWTHVEAVTFARAVPDLLLVG